MRRKKILFFSLYSLCHIRFVISIQMNDKMHLKNLHYDDSLDILAHKP